MRERGGGVVVFNLLNGKKKRRALDNRGGGETCASFLIGWLMNRIYHVIYLGTLPHL